MQGWFLEGHEEALGTLKLPMVGIDRELWGPQLVTALESCWHRQQSNVSFSMERKWQGYL